MQVASAKTKYDRQMVDQEIPTCHIALPAPQKPFDMYYTKGK